METDSLTKEYTSTEAFSLPADMNDDSYKHQFIDGAPFTGVTDDLSTAAFVNRNCSSATRDDTVPEVTLEIDDVFIIYIELL